MRRRLLSCVLSGMAGVWAGCGAAAPRQFQPSDRRSITQLLDEQRRAWNRGDVEAFMQGYARDPDLIFTSGGQIRRGYQATFDRYRSRYGEGSVTMGTLSFEVIEIRPLGGGGAVVLGRWGLSGLDAPTGGIFSVVLERRPEGWRIVHDHTSTATTKE